MIWMDKKLIHESAGFTNIKKYSLKFKKKHERF